MDDSVDILGHVFKVALRRAFHARHPESRQPNSRFPTVGNLIWERGQPTTGNCYFCHKAATPHRIQPQGKASLELFRFTDCVCATPKVRMKAPLSKTRLC